MIIRMDDSQATSLEQIRALVAANSVVRFAGQRREEVYHWVERTLVRLQYAGLQRRDKGVVRLYIAQMTGLSRAQVTRLITGYQRTGRVMAVPYQRTRFPKTYTAVDVELLAYVDRAHANSSGPAPVDACGAIRRGSYRGHAGRGAPAREGWAPRGRARS